MAGRESGRRVTVREAADELGISVDAVRKRIQRGALEATKDGQRVYIRLDDVLAVDESKRQVENEALYEQMRERIEDLKHQLDEEREARRRADTIIVQLSQTTSEQARTIQQLEAPVQAAERSEDAAHGDEPDVPVSSAGPPQENAQADVQRSWWRRIFGG